MVVAIVAPKAPDDMTGSIGFGVGVIPNAQLAGTTGQVARDLIRNRERWGLTYYPIPDRAMENFAPVLAALRGR